MILYHVFNISKNSRWLDLSVLVVFSYNQYNNIFKEQFESKNLHSTDDFKAMTNLKTNQRTLLNWSHLSSQR